MEVRIATFNIFWFPSSTFIGNSRSVEDLDKLREVIKRLDADILVFQEILDLQALENLLSLIPDRSYSLRDQDGNWAASGAEKPNDLKVPIAFDSNKLELLEAGRALLAGQSPASWGRRDPVAARFRPIGGGTPLTVIGVHLKSGILTEGAEAETPDDEIRIEEMENLTNWIKTLAPITPSGQPRPANESTVLIGDFNAIRGNVALKPLLSDAELSKWSWPQPRFASAMSPSTVEVNLPLKERWTTHLDREVIDHVIVSPEVKLVEGPWVYAFDYDDSWLQAANVTKDWLEQSGYTFKKGNNLKAVENLHRISDHRPVRVIVELT
uniref:EXOMEG1 n=1 Tax=uncultured organism TaxID=155900 RepID=A0A060DBV9_9ZZZZ|nr:EXOMEG1 [uncultured organism]